jgi:16S rRNA (uracil1498-N3)-methyltransferase
VFYKDSQRNLLELKDFIKNSKKISLFIGPEGDFSEEEIEFFKKQKNSYFASLSNNILRSETAAILSVGIVKLMG